MEFSIPMLTPGLANELAPLPLSEVINHLRNYLTNFLLDEAVTVVYINKLASAPELGQTPEAIAALHYCLRNYVKLKPFYQEGFTLLHNFETIPNGAAYQKLLSHFTAPEDLDTRLSHLESNGRLETVRRLLLDTLKQNPHALWAAERLLSHDSKIGAPSQDWLPQFACPSPLARAWELVLLRHFATVGDGGEVMERLDRLGGITSLPDDETVLNSIAEVLLAQGDRQGAMAAYTRSLALDPLQTPVAYRLEELRAPLVLDRSLLDTRTVNIYLYSYNKADFLEKTLLSLSETDLGKARINVLLNGCSDDSVARVTAIKEARYGDRLDSIVMRVNVGAPAARNWLIASPDTAKADYIAFLDDDVELPRDWLATFLTVMETRPKAGVVGCRVIQPGHPALMQYLYRNIALAQKSLIRISLDHPNCNIDTGLYAFTKDTVTVMGCCHLFRRQALLDAPTFDLRFSPSQMDDIAHDIDLKLLGYDVLYCGQVRCIHHQHTGNLGKDPLRYYGNVMGNDVKFYYKYLDRLSLLATLRHSDTGEDFRRALEKMPSYHLV